MIILENIKSNELSLAFSKIVSKGLCCDKVWGISIFAFCIPIRGIYRKLLLKTLAFYHVNDVQIHTSEQQLKDLGSHFEKSAFGPSVWIQIHIDIDFTKLGATAFIISFLRLRCGAHLIHKPTVDNVVEPLREDLIAFLSAYRDAMAKNIKTQILHKSYGKKKKSKTETKHEREFCMRGNEDLVQISLKQSSRLGVF